MIEGLEGFVRRTISSAIPKRCMCNKALFLQLSMTALLVSACGHDSFSIRSHLSEQRYYDYLATLVQMRLPGSPEIDQQELFIEEAIHIFKHERMIAYLMPGITDYKRLSLRSLDSIAVSVMDSGNSPYECSRLTSSIGGLMLTVAIFRNPLAPEDMAVRYADRLLSDHSIDFRLLLQTLRHLSEQSNPATQHLARRAVRQYAAYRRALIRIKTDMQPEIILLGIDDVLALNFAPEFELLAEGQPIESGDAEPFPYDVVPGRNNHGASILPTDSQTSLP